MYLYIFNELILKCTTKINRFNPKKVSDKKKIHNFRGSKIKFPQIIKKRSSETKQIACTKHQLD